MSLNIIFAGTPDFAVPALRRCLDSPHRVIAVYTQPDRPAGRGRALHISPVKQLANHHSIPVFQPVTLRDEAVQAQLHAHHGDVMVVVAYGLLVPKIVLQMPRLGCVNVHPSLLPRWRGAAPIPRAIEAGDSKTGVTIMQLEVGMDTGPILKQVAIDLLGDETSAQLLDRFSHLGATLLLQTLNELEQGIAHPILQEDALATHAAKISKSEALIDWQQPAIVIANKVRAFNPWPVATMIFQNQTLRIWESKALDESTSKAPGEWIRSNKNAFYVATGKGVLQILSVQLPGKRRMSAEEFLRGHVIHSGS